MSVNEQVRRKENSELSLNIDILSYALLLFFNKSKLFITFILLLYFILRNINGTKQFSTVLYFSFQS